MRKAHVLGLALLLGSAVPAVAAVGSGYTLFGNAYHVSPGNASNRAVKMEADVPSEFGGIDFAVPENFKVADLETLSTDYFFPAGSTCGGGAPRFQINVDGSDADSKADGSIFVYIGPPPNYTGCPSGAWQNTTNLVDPADLVDTLQLPGGAFYDPWAAVEDKYGSYTIVGIQLVTDTYAGAPGGSHTVVVDNTDIDGTLYTYEFTSKEDCKKDGYKKFTFSPGPFKNQGQCVSHFAKQK